MGALGLPACHRPTELSVAILPSTAYSSTSWKEDAWREKKGQRGQSLVGFSPFILMTKQYIEPNQIYFILFISIIHCVHFQKSIEKCILLSTA